jgi:hypothetical protein
MKRAACVLLEVLVIAGAAAGQGSAGGIKAGPMLCIPGSQESSSIYNPSNLLSLRFGFFYAQRVNDVLTLQPEVHLALKGSKYYSVVTRHDETARFNYLEFPLLVNARVPGGVFEVFAGPYAALLLSHTPIDDQHDWTWRENDLDAFDIGASLGARVWLGDLSLEVRFERGLSNVLPFGDRSHYNMALSLQVGYRLFK